MEMLNCTFPARESRTYGVFSKSFFLTTEFETENFTADVDYWIIEQKPVDMVCVPAGCAHQVENFGISLKVALDVCTKHCLPEIKRLAEYKLDKQFEMMVATYGNP